MQHQPHLVELGLARLEMLQALTLASLERQTSQNFLWVIRTDPDLNITLKEPFLEVLAGLLAGQHHHLLIASNENPDIQIHYLQSLNPKSIWSGDLESALRYLEPFQTPSYVVESRLDADDGLHEHFVQAIQSEALETLDSNTPIWKIWCGLRHLEWQYHYEYNGKSRSHKTVPSLGGLVFLKGDGCISAGLSIGYTTGVSSHDLPPIKHDQLHKMVPKCGDDAASQSKCLAHSDLAVAAIRARTPTSAGMFNVLWNATNSTDSAYKRGAQAQEAQQEKLWAIAESRFGFRMKTAKHVHDYLNLHMHEIALDNLRGQCTRGHSCKDQSKLVLNAIIDHPELW
jgi:hypothetical protein